MDVKKELKKIEIDFLSGLRFGLGGFPSVCSTPSRKTRSKGKGRTYRSKGR